MSSPVMLNCVTKTKRSVATGDVNGERWCIACGYDASSTYGYFVCQESYDEASALYTYHSITHYTQKRSEMTFSRVLDEFRRLIGEKTTGRHHSS